MRKKRKSRFVDVTNDIIPQNNQPPVYLNRLKPKSDNQKEYIRTIAESIVTFCEGVAGSGKTHIAVGMAVEYLLEEKVEKIIITRPIIEAGERIGFLPGTAEEKLHPYLLPILDEISYFVGMSGYKTLKALNKIEIVPLALMRGRSFHNSFIVADEAQNASYEQLKMLLTRIGNDSKMVITGDITQSDLNYKMQSGFLSLIKRLSTLEDIGISKLDTFDIVRNPIIAKILYRLEKYEDEKRKY